MTHSRQYHSWMGMHQRCYNPKHPRYADYGGRGIQVCERWNTFEAFFADMGTCPPNRSIDRIDNDGNYEPCNCHWATVNEQRSTQRPGWKKRVRNAKGQFA